MNLPKQSDKNAGFGRLTVLPNPLLQLQSPDTWCDQPHLHSTLSFHGAKRVTWIRTSVRSICGRFFWQLLAMQGCQDRLPDVRSIKVSCQSIKHLTLRTFGSSANKVLPLYELF
jgi:hypothetical protein